MIASSSQSAGTAGSWLNRTSLCEKLFFTSRSATAVYPVFWFVSVRLRSPSPTAQHTTGTRSDSSFSSADVKSSSDCVPCSRS